MSHKGSGVATPGLEEFEREMPHSANAYDRDSVHRLYIELKQRVEHRIPGAEQWPRSRLIDAGWLLDHAGGRCAHLVGKAAVASDDGGLRRQAEIVVAALAQAGQTGQSTGA